MTNKYISSFIISIAVIINISSFIYFVVNGFGIMGVIIILLSLGFIVIYMQNRELKRMIKELGQKVDEYKS